MTTKTSEAVERIAELEKRGPVFVCTEHGESDDVLIVHSGGYMRCPFCGDDEEETAYLDQRAFEYGERWTPDEKPTHLIRIAGTTVALPSAVAYDPRHNYIKKLNRLIAEGKLAPGDVARNKLTIEHDEWCPIDDDGICDCDPEITQTVLTIH
jgi:hypothetical protein